ncbi:hypothetical protein [Hyalangium rubrum]|uniref:Uncharacterized protein n=1 Tax=Hyalangium rubrum TaxID=3103134 RepID=A0ABU5H1B1_9BACT|nr:hypothetical protein [Hyalangium sp. s54d21]MDY7225910.1 hypothetical protein [Hyalangium sp. s54d21]
MDNPKRGHEKFSGSTFRAYLDGLDAMGLRAVVRLMVPPHVQGMMDTPPVPTVWMESDALPLIFDAVMKLQGLEGMRALGYAATSGTTGRFLKPLMQMMLNKHGRSPASLFANMSSLYRSFFQGLEFKYTPEGARSGMLQIRSNSAMGASSWAAWEGSLRLLFEECGVTTGVISPSHVSEEGRVATMRVRW